VPLISNLILAVYFFQLHFIDLVLLYYVYVVTHAYTEY